MRRSWIAVVVALSVVFAPSVANAARVQPDLAYVGAWWTTDHLGNSWVVRAVGVNGSWAAVTQVSYYFADGTSVTLEPRTLRFFSGAGSEQWGSETFTTVVPPGAVAVGADVRLIELKKPATIKDEVIVPAVPFDGFVGNLYCSPAYYPRCD